MIHRTLQSKAKELSKKYPVVTITGPRQSGKTTLVKETFDQHEYYSLENPVTRELVQHDPLILFEPRGKNVIIDEVQKYPEILSFVQIHADEQKNNGQFIITGSQSLLLSEKVSQSLAGRTAILKLLPFSHQEIGNLFDDYTYEDWIFKGFYPRIYDQDISPGDFYPFYFETYLQRDVREIQNVRNLNQFSNFVRLCAGRIGQILDLSSLANDAGITVNTVKGWLSVLEASYVITLLQPYYKNFSKRIIKSPKLYFTDVGLASFLLNINDPAQLETHYLKGNLFENLIIIEILKRRLNAALPPNLYFYRDSNKNEVDCIVEDAEIRALEIKSSRTFSSGFVNGLITFSSVSGLNPKNGFIIYGGKEQLVFKGFQVLPWNNLADF
jgi:predicted AAA+ superfamily ATPase